MQIVAKIELNLDNIADKKGLEVGGIGQKFVDSECIRLMDSYTPFMNGELLESLRSHTTIGSGELHQVTPYARYLFYGYLMVDPITGKGCFRDKNGRMWSRPNVSKVLTNTSLHFNTARSPLAGARWFDRMVKDHGDEIGEGLAKLTGGKYERN